MAFNFKAFASAFMEDQAKAITERVTKAEEYADEQRDEFERSKAVFKKRKTFVNNVMSTVNNIRRLGASESQIKAAVANGPETVFTLYNALDTRAQQLDKTRLDKSEVDALIDMPDTFEKDQYSLEDFVKTTYGLTKPDIGSTKDPDRSMLQRAFGIGLRDQVRADLDARAEYDGYSLMDINEMARQDAYESLVPGSPFRIMPGKTYDRMDVFKDFERAKEAVRDALEKDQVYIDLKAGGDLDAIRSYEQSQMFPMVQMFVKDYKKPFLDDNDLYKLEGLLSKEQLGQVRMSIDSDALEKELMSKFLVDGGGTFTTPYIRKDGSKGRFTFVIDPTTQEVLSGKKDNQPIASSALEDIFQTVLYQGATFTSVNESGQPVSDQTASALGDPKTLTEETAEVSDIDIRDNITPATPLTSEARESAEQIMRGRFGSLFTVGTDPSDNYTDLYTREQYESMTSRQRRERGLPVSIIGAKQFYFRDEIEDLFIDKGVYDTLEGSNIKLNPTEDNYKVKIKGMLGTFNVTKEQLDEMPLSAFEGVDPVVTIDRYGEDEEPLRKKISSSVIKRLSRGSVEEKEDVVVEEEEDKDVSLDDVAEKEKKISYTKDSPLDLKSMTEEEAEDAFENLKVGDYFINPLDGRVLRK